MFQTRSEGIFSTLIWENSVDALRRKSFQYKEAFDLVFMEFKLDNVTLKLEEIF